MPPLSSNHFNSQLPLPSCIQKNPTVPIEKLKAIFLAFVEQQNRQQQVVLIQRAKFLCQHGDIAGAESLAKTLYPVDYLESENIQARCQFLRGQIREALYSSEFVLTYHPKDGFACASRAFLAFCENKFELADALLRKTLESDPSDYLAIITSHLLHPSMMNGKTDSFASFCHYDHLFKKAEQDPHFWNIYARVQLILENYPSAFSLAEKVLESLPHHPLALETRFIAQKNLLVIEEHLNAAQELLFRSEIERAYQIVQKFPQNHPIVIAILARHTLLEGDVEATKKLITPTTQQGLHPLQAGTQAFLFYLEGEIKEAQSIAEQVIDKEEVDFFILIVYYFTLVKKPPLLRATVEETKDLIDIAMINNPHLMNIYARMCLLTQNYNNALKYAETFLVEFPSDSFAQQTRMKAQEALTLIAT